MKYTIEGNIDFFAELHKSLHLNEKEINNDIHKNEDENKCLITHEPLIDKHVKLDCGHSFNYIPLFTDVLIQKYLYNGSEDPHSKVAFNEIRCPFCRKKQNKLLPYYEELGLKKINGVNQIGFGYYNRCFHKIPNKYYNPEIPESLSNQKEHDCHCTPTNVIDNNLYCFKHNLKVIKEVLQKQKEEAKQKKALEKQVLLEAKLKLKEEKQKEKEEKKKQKEEKKKEEKKNQKVAKKPQTLQTTYTSTPETAQNNPHTCLAILKSGQRKGQCCGMKTFALDFCKRHYGGINTT